MASSLHRVSSAGWQLDSFGWEYHPHGVDLEGLFGRFNARPTEELARVVADRIEQLTRSHWCERIDLVGHSEGGLIGRYYVQKLDGASHAETGAVGGLMTGFNSERRA